MVPKVTRTEGQSLIDRSGKGMEAEVWGDVEETGWETINKEHRDEQAVTEAKPVKQQRKTTCDNNYRQKIIKSLSD